MRTEIQNNTKYKDTKYGSFSPNIFGNFCCCCHLDFYRVKLADIGERDYPALLRSISIGLYRVKLADIRELDYSTPLRQNFTGYPGTE